MSLIPGPPVLDPLLKVAPAIDPVGRKPPEGGLELAPELLVHTEGRADRDVRVKKLPVGAWAFVWSGAAAASQWAGIKADVVEVPRDR